MNESPLQSFVLEATGAPATASAPPRALGPPCVAFHPLTPAPIVATRPGTGQAIWFCGPHGPADAALAWLIRAPGEGPRALIELSDQGDADLDLGEPSLLGVRVARTTVQRASVDSSQVGLRKLVLWLDECRRRFCYTAVVGGADQQRRHLARLADRVVVVTSADEASVRQSQQSVHWLRSAGARNRECLWLDAA